MGREQIRNKKNLPQSLSVYTISSGMAIGRPLKPEHLRRSKMFPLRLTPSEWAALSAASRQLKESVAAILRTGAALYIRRKGKGGSRRKKEATK
jgi:hypothetical protein